MVISMLLIFPSCIVLLFFSVTLDGILNLYLVLFEALALPILSSHFFFFFQAEDGIRDVAVTGVQTCALPISRGAGDPRPRPHRPVTRLRARLPRPPRRGQRGPQLLRAAPARAHVEHGGPRPQLLGEPFRDPPGYGLPGRGEAADSAGPRRERRAPRRHHLADAVQR